MNTPVTLLFTDLGDPTDLLQRVGAERVQRLFQAHHRLLEDSAAAHGGQEVRLLGDGLLTAFASAADAVRAAVALQQAARRRAAGERLALRVGLHAGEAPREETDYVGTPVLIARRLCAQAQAGQILASGVVAGLLAGRQAFRFSAIGALELTGLTTPVTAYEVPYQQDEPAALLRPPGGLRQRAGPIHADQGRQSRAEPDRRPPRRTRPPSHGQHQDRDLLLLRPRPALCAVDLLRKGSRGFAHRLVARDITDWRAPRRRRRGGGPWARIARPLTCQLRPPPPPRRRTARRPPS